MSATGLTRRLRFFERAWPWLSFSLLAALLTAAAVALLDAGVLAEYELFPSITRGYTFSGVVLGLCSLALCFVAFFYSLRKRGLQEQLPLGKSTMTAWLWAHVYFGLLALLLCKRQQQRRVDELLGSELPPREEALLVGPVARRRIPLDAFAERR